MGIYTHILSICSYSNTASPVTLLEGGYRLTRSLQLLKQLHSHQQ